MFKRMCFTLFLFIASTTIFAQATQDQILAMTQSWQNAINSRNAEKITALYDKNAFLYATFEDMLSSQEQILGYFKKLVKHDNLKVKFDKQNIRLYGETAIDSGLYTFTYDDKGKEVMVPARYTLVYTHTPNGWTIVEHHSSVLPN